MEMVEEVKLQTRYIDNILVPENVQKVQVPVQKTKMFMTEIHEEIPSSVEILYIIGRNIDNISTLNNVKEIWICNGNDVTLPTNSCVVYKK